MTFPSRLVSTCMVTVLCLTTMGQLPVNEVDSNSINKKRFRFVVGTEAVLYSATMIGLNELWYADYERSKLHHFNDNAEWMQMDKVGHAVTSYYTGLLGMEALRWAGVDDRKSRWYGGALGWFFLGSVEMLDGYSAEWGFSSGDLIANTLGTGLLIGQDAAWGEQRITLKFSYFESTYAQLRPQVLGDGLQERLLKDYNAQTYWASANIHSFLPEESRFPRWLSLSVGYGADEMLWSRGDFSIINTETGTQTFSPFRQYYIGPDIDLWRIKTKKKWLKTVFKTIGFIRLPIPALRLEQGKLAIQGFRF